MRHERVARRLSQYLDGTLPGRDLERVEAHLSECGECRTQLMELRRTAQLLRSLRGATEPADLAAAVLARIRAGEAEPSFGERLRASLGRFFAGSFGAPLATAAVGLAVLTLLPKVEIEISLPGGAAEVAKRVARAPAYPHPPLTSLAAARRVNESPLPDRTERAAPLSPPCWEQPSFEACQEQSELFMELALQDTRAFVERVEAVPSTQRERWIGELSRLAAESGAASSVAERLRETDDPRAWQMATHFDVASFDGR